MSSGARTRHPEILLESISDKPEDEIESSREICFTDRLIMLCTDQDISLAWLVRSISSFYAVLSNDFLAAFSKTNFRQYIDHKLGQACRETYLKRIGLHSISFDKADTASKAETKFQADSQKLGFGRNEAIAILSEHHTLFAGLMRGLRPLRLKLLDGLRKRLDKSLGAEQG